MNGKKNHVYTWLCIIACLLTSCFAQPSQAQESGSIKYENWCDADPFFCEPYFLGRSILMENDRFFAKRLGLNEDRNYTMGFVYQSSGRWLNETILIWPLRFINWITRFKRVHDLPKKDGTVSTLSDTDPFAQFHTFQLGSSAFTPDSLHLPDPIFDDRPYSSLLFIGVRRHTLIAEKWAAASELKIGVLGLRLSETGQTWLHEVMRDEGCDRLDPKCGAVDPQGWPNQISDKGELTGRYTISFQRLLRDSFEKNKSFPKYDLQATVDAQVGYHTDLTFRLAGRWGIIQSSWWHFRPTPISEQVIMASATQSAPVSHTSFNQYPVKPSLAGCINEAYLWGGLGLRKVGYNVLLQGQRKDNVHELRPSELRRLVFEFQVGFTVNVGAHGVSLALAGRSSEHNLAQARPHIWGGVYYTYSRFLERAKKK